MQARKALLKKLASVTDWDSASHASFEGECWLESRNTIYRLRDGVCFAVASRDPRKTARARTLVGMRLVGWLAGTAERSVFAHVWEAGACALLWRGGQDDAEEAIAMTSPTTTFRRGASSAHLQALHDHAPPPDSRIFRRRAPSTHGPASHGSSSSATRTPSQPSYRSG